MSHKKSKRMIDLIEDVLMSFYYELGTPAKYEEMGSLLYKVFLVNFDSYWINETGIDPKTIQFTPSMGKSMFIVTVNGKDPKPLAEFINDIFGTEATRNRIIDNILQQN